MRVIYYCYYYYYYKILGEDNFAFVYPHVICDGFHTHHVGIEYSIEGRFFPIFIMKLDGDDIGRTKSNEKIFFCFLFGNLHDTSTLSITK